jgi:hypothetical protein
MTEDPSWVNEIYDGFVDAEPDPFPNVLDQAQRIVNGDRQDFYGHPTDNHGCTAQMWTAYIQRKYGVSFEFTVRDVCWLNGLQKISRDAHQEKRDNLVDVAGYVLNIDMDQRRKAKLWTT